MPTTRALPVEPFAPNWEKIAADGRLEVGDEEGDEQPGCGISGRNCARRLGSRRHAWARCCRYAKLRDVPGRLGDDDLRRDVELDGVRGDRRNRTRRRGRPILPL